MSSLHPFPTLILSYWIRRWLLFNLKKNKHATGFGSPKKISLLVVSSSPTDPTPDSIKYTAAKLIFLKAQPQLFPTAQPSCSKPFKGSSCLSERRNCLNSIAWDSEPLIIWHWVYPGFPPFFCVVVGSKWITSPFSGGTTCFIIMPLPISPFYQYRVAFPRQFKCYPIYNMYDIFSIPSRPLLTSPTPGIYLVVW